MKMCETFRSIQGEGLMIGSLTYFIRLSGCNLSCRWCDTKYSKEESYDMSVKDILKTVKGDKNICITGGEPLLQDEVYELMDELLKKDKNIVLETNGSIDISKVPKDPRLMISMDIKCPSSGMEEKMFMDNLKELKSTDQLKFIIENGEDFEYAITFLDESIRCSVIVCPVGGMDIEPLAEEVIERRLNVRVLPQLHKLIWGNKRSV